VADKTINFCCFLSVFHDEIGRILFKKKNFGVSRVRVNSVGIDLVYAVQVKYVQQVSFTCF